MAEPITLAGPEFAMLWSRAGDAPSPIGTPRYGTTPSAKARLAEACSAELDLRGLGTVDDPRPDLAALVEILADAEHAFHIELSYLDGQGRACVATARTGVVAATWDGTQARLWPVRPGTAVAATIDLMPPAPPGPGRSASLHRRDYAAACTAGTEDGQTAFLATLRRAGQREPEAYTALAASTGRVGCGHITVGGNAVTWVDTAEGRYMMRSSGDWLTIVPADHARVSAAVAELG